MFNPRWIIGRKIVALDVNPFDDGKGGTAHDPRIILDNGASIAFVTEETETGEYGTDLVYRKPAK